MRRSCVEIFPLQHQAIEKVGVVAGVVKERRTDVLTIQQSLIRRQEFSVWQFLRGDPNAVRRRAKKITNSTRDTGKATPKLRRFAEMREKSDRQRGVTFATESRLAKQSLNMLRRCAEIRCEKARIGRKVYEVFTTESSQKQCYQYLWAEPTT